MVKQPRSSSSRIKNIARNSLEAIRRQLDFERRTLAPEGCILETLPHVSRLSCADPQRHMITFSSFSDDIADGVIAEQAAHYRALAAQVEWKLYQHDWPPDLLQRLERYGFLPGPRESVLVFDLQEQRSWIDEPAAHSITCIESGEQVNRYRQSAEEIFEREHQGIVAELLSGIRRGSTRQRGYIAMDGRAAVSIGRLYTDPQSAFGGLYGGGTPKQYRGLGLYRAMVAARARAARNAGARFLIVDALPTSRPILENLGFVRLTDTWPCTLNI